MEDERPHPDYVDSESPIPDDLTPYIGRWVAIRNKEVYLAHEDLAELLQSPDYEQGTLVYKPRDPSVERFLNL